MTGRSTQLGRFAAGAFAMLTSGGAIAQTPAYPEEMRFEWSRGPEASSCAEASEIEADVVRRLGWNPFSPTAKSSLECHVTRENGVWMATIEERNEQGVRAGFRVVTSPAESCGSLGAAVGLALALVVRSRAASPGSSPPAPTVRPCPPAIATPPCAPTKQELPEERSGRASWVLAATGAVRVLPEAALGGSLIGFLSLSSSLSLSVDLSFLPEVRRASSLGEFGFGATWGALGACYDVDVGADVGLSGCASAALGAMYVAVYDPSPVEPGAHLFAGATAGPRVHWKFAEPAELFLGVDGFFPFAGNAFLVDYGGVTATVFEQPAVGALFKLGLGFAP